MTRPSIRALLPADFAERYWRKRPLLIRGGGAAFTSLVGEEEVERFEEDFFAAPASWRTGSVGQIGSTSYVGNAECLNEQLAELCTELRDEFRWPHAEVSIVRNRELTSWIPSGPHFDQTDNFVIQASGSKQWRIWSTDRVSADEKRRRMLKLPQYGEVAIPRDAADLVELTVEPGDLLYLPLFWGHSVRSLGPGVMLSINLKAVTAGQALLRGLSTRLGDLEDDADPLPLPLEVGDWNDEMGRRMAVAYEQMSRTIAPVLPGSAPPDAAAIAESGLEQISSVRHRLLLKKDAPAGSIRVGKLFDVVAERLEQTPFAPASMLRTPPGEHDARAAVETLGLVHAHRFLALLSLGPQDWWPAAIAGRWGSLRDRIEGMDADTLLARMADSGQVEATNRFADDMRAFNRRHALESLSRWARAVTEPIPAAGAYDDVDGRFAASTASTGKVRAALAYVDDRWPSFSAAFTTLVPTIVVDALGRQTPIAAGRVRVAAVRPDWTPEQTGVALVGEYMRTMVSIVARIGAIKPGADGTYRGGPQTGLDDMTRAAALAATAAFRRDADDHSAADAEAGLAAALVARIDRDELTVPGQDLLDAIRPGPAAPTRCLGDVLAGVEDIQRADVDELVDGHAWANARFRWSDLRREQPADVRLGIRPGMDCSPTPWLVAVP